MKNKKSTEIPKFSSAPPLIPTNKDKSSSKITGLNACVAMYHDLLVFAENIPQIYNIALQQHVSHLDQEKIDLITGILSCFMRIMLLI